MRNALSKNSIEGWMKHWLIAAVSSVLLCLAVVAAGQREELCKVTLNLVDVETGQVTAGLIRVVDQAGGSVIPRVAPTPDGILRQLVPRGLGIKDQPGIEQWSVVTGSETLLLPRRNLMVEAFSGLDTELKQLPLDLTQRESFDLTIPLIRFYDAASRGMRSANTHLHLMKITREEADRYLFEVPRADRLDLLFVSYLERAEADRDYTSNHYTRRDLEQLSKQSGTIFGNGQEHRHNFTAQGQGYGHVMLLDIPQLIHPVSIGPGITKTGTDGLPLQRGIDETHRQQGTAIWCHNNWGLERIANQITGRLDAQNIYDGSMQGSFKDSFYRSLNSGLQVPFSTGTDWFLFDFSRAYAKVDEPLTPRSWLKALATGRTYITNGPFLEFKVAEKEPGERVLLDQAGVIEVEARGIGRVGFQRIEVVQNGHVIRSQRCRQEAGHYVAELKFDLLVTAPSWLALRIPPPPIKDDPELTDAVPLNEYGKPLFAHTSAVAVEIAGKSHFDPKVARELLEEMKSGLRMIHEQARFADDIEKARVTDVYLDAISQFESRLNAAEGH
jgi:hypothetical protein